MCLRRSSSQTAKSPTATPGLSTAELRTLCAGCPADMPPDVLAIPNLANCSGGTTGKTKVIEQDMPAGESDEGLRTWFAVSGMRFEMRQLLAGPLFHGAPHSAAFNGLYCGNTLVMPAKLDAETIVRLIKKYHIEYVQMVPTLMQRIGPRPASRKKCRASRCCAIPAASARRISSVSGFRSFRPSGSMRCTP